MPNLLKFLAALALALAASSAFATGRFAYVDGSVSVRDGAGAIRPIRTGDAIRESESVFVGEGRAHIRFDDGGWIALQPRTVFEVKEYTERGDGNIVLSLLKGSARAVTGRFASRRPTAYQFVTPTATIGIRGTSFVVTYCVQSCDVPDGLYVTGGDGTIFVKNGFGEIDLSRGKTAYVANAQTPPRESSVKPLAEVPEQMTSQQLSATSSTSTGELRPGNYIYFQSASGYTGPFRTISISSLGLAMAASGTISASASGIERGVFKSATGTATGAGFGGGTGTVSGGDTLTVVLDSANLPVSLTATGADGSRVSATALNAPQAAGSDGILTWGRWTATTFQFDAQGATGNNATGSAQLNPGSYIHYMVGLPTASVPLSGIATYTYMGGSGSTAQSGTVGAGVTAGSLTANFGANTVSTNVSISHSGAYTATGSGFLTAGKRAEFSSTTGTASGPGGSFGFKFEGFFAGPGAPTAPARAAYAWEINRPDPVVGTAGFSCATGC